MQNATADTISAQIEAEKQKALKEDNANKSLLDNVNVLVHAYQAEYERYDGNGRNQLLEQDLIDAANRKLRNYFFPNDPQTPLPSLPDGVWKNFISFSGSKAIGKSYTEAYSVVTKEQDLINAINAQITIIEGLVAATRSSGDEIAVVTNPTPPPATIEVKQSSTTMQNAATAMITAVQNWENFLNATYALVPTALIDPDASRTTENNASRADITNAISIINTWQAYQNFDTVTVTPITAAAFNAFPASSFFPSKFRATEMQPLKNEITARQAFITTRMTQLSGHLGAIVQDMSNGDLTTATGFYGQRIRIIDTRINAMGGSLTKLKGLERGQAAQDQAKKSNDNAALVYTSVMLATGFRAPATGNSTIHVLSAAGFSIGNTVYICADNQEEIQTTITNIQGNAVTLAVDIPQKYRQNEFARLYKVL